MFKLYAKSPFEGLLPRLIGSVEIRECITEYVTLVDIPLGREDQVCSVLKRNHGITLPKVNKSTGQIGRCCLSFGGRYLLIGLKPCSDLANVGRLTDVSDGFAILHAEGEEIEAVLARLVPINLCKSVFKIGDTAKTLVQHMQASITKTSEKNFQIMVFRSMAYTLVHDLVRAMDSIAYRVAISTK